MTYVVTARVVIEADTKFSAAGMVIDALEHEYEFLDVEIESVEPEALPYQRPLEMR